MGLQLSETVDEEKLTAAEIPHKQFHAQMPASS